MSSTQITDGIEYIKAQLVRLPAMPGVYRMLNAAGDVLYVGKAKNLKNRVTSYTQPERMGARIRKMVFETRELVIVETRTEAEALLLEANLIKSLKPKYNITFRDDSTYPSIVITKEDTPRVRSHRGSLKQKAHVFGPYPDAGAVHRTIDLLERAFRLRTCADSVFRHRTRPCLKYDVKRCSAPCVGKIDAEDYRHLVQQALDFLDGKGTAVHKALQEQMADAAANWNYEEAATIRDRLQALASINTAANAMTHALPEADVFALVQSGGQTAVQGFFYRGGQHVGNHTYYPKGVEELDAAETLRVFLSLHYAARPAPPLVLTSDAVADSEALAEALSYSAGRKVQLLVPQRGDRYKVVQQALKNAQNALQRRQTEHTAWAKQMEAFAEHLGRELPIERVEAFDISNISGTSPVASLVVATQESMDKRQYRKFAIKGKNTPDDYSMMHEALTRRYKRLLKDSEAGLSAFPSVILVDGGIGHLNVLVKVAQELEFIDEPDCPELCAIAKGEQRDKGLEKLYHYRDGEIVQLPILHDTPLIFVLQQIRDESHRFAIGYHRQKRSKELSKSKLDGIPGIGAKRKKALLLHFGSAKGVEGATVEEIARVPGISPQLAEEIYSWLRG